MKDVVIDVKGLTRTFGDVYAVRGASFHVERGEVAGFIGANGAGKTTTMRIMATLDVPDAGSVRVCGFDAVEQPGEVRRRIGWMPDSYPTYQHTTVFEYLDFFARAYGYRGVERHARVDSVMTFTDLHDLAHREMSLLSKGMGQRLCLGRALLNDPELLILDEPAAGLDPKARVELRELIRLLAKDGKTIFISSHILSELAEMCDQLLLLHEGVVVHSGSPESFTRPSSAHSTYSVLLDGTPEALEEWVILQPDVRLVELQRGGALIRIDAVEPDRIAAVLRRMIQHGLPVLEFHRTRARLEDSFIDILKTLQPESIQ